MIEPFRLEGLNTRNTPLRIRRIAMQIEQIRLRNFRAFRDVTMKDIPRFCVLVGANGSGKSTLFSVFAFLRDAMAANVTSALARLGGSRGFHEIRSRGTSGPGRLH